MERRSKRSGLAIAGMTMLLGVIGSLHRGEAARLQLAFDAASIKENRDVERGRLSVTPGGAVTARHMKPSALITFAFELRDYQLADAPEWLDRTFYDVVARPAASATTAQARAMLRALLVERFRLRFHRETRELNGFSLVRTAGSAKGLRPSSVNCEVAVSSAPECRESVAGEGTLKLYGAYMSCFITLLINEEQQPIQDRTALTGNLDIELRWSQPGADNLPSLYTALSEQLGLKLERGRVPTEMFVIDSIERPTPD